MTVDPTEFIVLPESKSPTTDRESNLESYSLVDEPSSESQISIDPADLCPDEDTATSDEISVLTEPDGGSPDRSDAGVTEGTISSIVMVDAECEEEQTTPVVTEVVMEEINAGVEEAKPVVELELDVEPEDDSGTVEATLEDITEEFKPELEETPFVELEKVKEVEAEKPSDKDSGKDSGKDSDVDSDKDSDHSSGEGTVSEGSLPEVDIMEEAEEEEEESSPKSKPLSHVISSAALVTILLVLSSSGEENLPDRTEIALSSLFLAYLVTYAAVDLELLSSANLKDWLNASFNLVVGPLLSTFVVYTSTMYPDAVALMVPALGGLLVVEASVLVDHLEPKSIAQGIVASVAGVFIYTSLKGIGNAEPIVTE